MRVKLEFEADSLEELYEFLGERVIFNAFRDGKVQEPGFPYQRHERYWKLCGKMTGA